MNYHITENLVESDIKNLYEDIFENDNFNIEKIACCGCVKPSGSGWCMPFTGPCNATSTCKTACANIGLAYSVCDTSWSTYGSCASNGICRR